MLILDISGSFEKSVDISNKSGKSTDIPRKNLCFFKQRQRKRSVDFPVDSEGLIRLGGALSC
jgi:hypothetical protein